MPSSIRMVDVNNLVGSVHGSTFVFWGPMSTCCFYKWLISKNKTQRFIPFGLWIWPPWVISATAPNHKIGNAAYSGVSKVLFFMKSHKWKKKTSKEMDNWKATTRYNLLLKISNDAPIHDGCPTDPITAQIIISRWGVTMVCLFSDISEQQFHHWKFRHMFTESSTCYLNLEAPYIY